MTLEILKQIRKRVERATPGPWEFDHSINTQNHSKARGVYARPSEYHCLEIIETPDLIDGECIHQSDEDAAFIAAARTDIPLLLDLVELAAEGLENYAKGWPGPVGSHHEHLERISEEARAQHARETLSAMEKMAGER